MNSTHFIGIGGTGLSAIARVLLERGEAVSGSDREMSPLAESLQKAGARVSIGHAASNVNGAARVIRSSAVGDDNVEVQAALSKGIPVYKRADILGDLLAGQQTIAVAGSHGKTTTSAMLAWMLTALNQRPGYILGSPAQNLGGNAAAGAGRSFVIEADEYDYMFLGLKPDIALITNVEHDHPDCFPTEEDFFAAFRAFVDRLESGCKLLLCADDPGALRIAAYAADKDMDVLTYSINSQTNADYLAEYLSAVPGAGFSFHARRGQTQLAKLALQVPGRHNAQNALGALAVADLLGLALDEAAMALADFRGTGRRFEERPETAGVLIVDDYAHHPTEIRAALAAARQRYPERRIWALWQPHTYSRSLLLADDFAQAFGDADRVLVSDVYAARESKPEDFEIDALVSSIRHESVSHAGDLAAARQLLLKELQPGDLLIVLSAGDAVQLSAALHKELDKKEHSDA